jgi:hypothetical protein
VATAHQVGNLAVERHASGIEIVGPEVMQAIPADEKQAIAMSEALLFMSDHPNDIGYPRLEPATGALEISSASDQAASLVATELAPLIPDTPNTMRTVEFSYADLVGVSDAIIELIRSGADGFELVWEIEPDHVNNRLIINISAVDDSLLADLHKRFGDAVAVRVADRPKTSPGDSRQNDPSPYYGGAQVRSPSGGTCSDAFTWTNGSLWSGVLTAAHCAPSGGNFTCCNPNQGMGTVTAGSRENWTTGVGTVKYAGDSINRGDVALVQLQTGRSVSVRMWRGVANGVGSSIVRIVWQRLSQPGDDYCTGGRTTGEICGYDVKAVGIDHVYEGGEVIRNAVRGEKSGLCHNLGDSGGSVFTLYQDGVAAKGVHSGGGVNIFGTCFELFTDIQYPIQGLPGGVPSLP